MWSDDDAEAVEPTVNIEMKRLPFGPLASAAVLFVAGCDVSWPGTEPGAEYDFVDSWTITCECVGIQRGTGLQVADFRDELSICSDGTPSPAYADAQCGSLANRLRTYDTDYTCAFVSSPAPRRDEVTTCPYRTRVSSPLTSDGAASQSYALGWPNPMADFEGVLTSSDALISINYLRWRDARPSMTGHVYFTGGNCAGSTCEVTLDGIELEVDDFVIDRPWPARDTNVRLGLVRNLTRWVGLRLPDGSVEFPDADLVITGRIDGDEERMVVHAPEPIRGRFIERDHDGQRYFVLEGSLRGDDVRLQLNARFLQVGGTPTAAVSTTTSCSSGVCLHTHAAAGSRTFDGQAVRLYRWYDANRRLLGVSSTFRSRSDTVYPLTLRVEDADGRFDTLEVRRPISLPRLPISPLPSFR